MHESDARSISTVPKGEQVKMTSFLALGGKFCTGILALISRMEFLDISKKAHQNQPDTLCFCQRGFRVTALLIRSLQLLMTGIQSRPEHPGYSLPDMQPE